MATAITEKDGIHKEWMKQAKEVKSPKDLAKFIEHLTTDYRHDYGTICHAIAAAAIAGAYTVEHSPQGGITGFQSGCIFWEFYQAWMQEEGPARLQRMNDLLFPQMENKFTTISPDTWKYVQEEARKYLAKDTTKEFNYPPHPEVKAHWESIVSGRIPFGLTIQND